MDANTDVPMGQMTWRAMAEAALSQARANAKGKDKEEAKEGLTDVIAGMLKTVYLQGIQEFAYMRNGKLYVGTTEHLLKQVKDEVERKAGPL